MILFCFKRFLQYVASNNCTFSLENFMDRTTAQGKSYKLDFFIIVCVLIYSFFSTGICLLNFWMVRTIWKSINVTVDYTLFQ